MLTKKTVRTSVIEEMNNAVWKRCNHNPPTVMNGIILNTLARLPISSGYVLMVMHFLSNVGHET